MSFFRLLDSTIVLRLITITKNLTIFSNAFASYALNQKPSALEVGFRAHGSLSARKTTRCR